MVKLAELFFKTGKSFTEFVKITYKFQILLPVDNPNNTNDTDDNGDDGEFKCISDQKSLFGVLLLYICLALNHYSGRHCLLCM